MNQHQTFQTTDRRGMTLVEILIVISIFAFIVAGAMGFMATQSKAFYRGAERMTALQNLRFTLDRLETDIQTAGTGVAPGQPWMLYAGENVLAFSADYATNVSGNLGAVYYDPGAPSGTVSSLRTPVTIPGTSFVVGDTLYQDPPGSAIPSPAEVIMFYFEQDTATTRSDDWALYRKVNSNPPELVSRNLLKAGSEPFFRYFYQRDSVGVASFNDSIPNAQLPLKHLAKLEASVADTGQSGKLDLFRSVRVQVRGTNGLTGPEERTADLSLMIDMRNSKYPRLQSCGDDPILGTAGFAAFDVDTLGGVDAVLLQWNPATDETMGEQDVIRYTIWRRLTGNPWGDPFVSIPAGAVTYSYLDTNVTVGDTYIYAVAAQDCTPKLSGMLEAAPVTVN
ncbi:MAG: type II secretion system protein [Gemmatimonadota bacterium]